MSLNFQKFLFLGVMIALTMMGGGWNSSGTSATALQSFTSAPSEARGQAASIESSVLSEGSAAAFVSAPIISENSGDVSSTSGGNSALVGESLQPNSNPTQGIREGAVQAADNSRFSFFRPRAGWSTSPDIQAHVALVADLQSGEIYFEKNGADRWPLASITKLTTAAYATLHIGNDQLVSVGAALLVSLNPESSSSSILPGEYAMHDLLYALLLPSSNVAAEALAQNFGREQFLAGMNALATEWGAASTHFEDPTGLSPANQSTAHDILKIAQAIYIKYPEIFKITRTPKFTITEHTSGKRQSFASINLFAGKPDFIGGKTGYTDEAGGNLVSVFSDGGRPILIMALGTDDRFGETEKLLSWFKESFTIHP